MVLRITICGPRTAQTIPSKSDWNLLCIIISAAPYAGAHWITAAAKSNR